MIPALSARTKSTIPFWVTVTARDIHPKRHVTLLLALNVQAELRRRCCRCRRCGGCRCTWARIEILDEEIAKSAESTVSFVVAEAASDFWAEYSVALSLAIGVVAVWSGCCCLFCGSENRFRYLSGKGIDIVSSPSRSCRCERNKRCCCGNRGRRCWSGRWIELITKRGSERFLR